MVDGVTRHYVQRLANRVTFELSGTHAASVVLNRSSFHSPKLAFAALQRYGDARRRECAAGMRGARGGREGGGARGRLGAAVCAVRRPLVVLGFVKVDMNFLPRIAADVSGRVREVLPFPSQGTTLIFCS